MLAERATTHEGPYIITKLEPVPTGAEHMGAVEMGLEPSTQIAVPRPGSMRRTVASLVRAVAELSYENWCACYEHCENAYSLPPSGGRVGPLPDGSTLLVEPTKWSRLCGDVGSGGSSHDPDIWKPEIVNRWNARRAHV